MGETNRPEIQLKVHSRRGIDAGNVIQPVEVESSPTPLLGSMKNEACNACIVLPVESPPCSGYREKT
ncbi:hypothetical protein L1887_19706 [Cichorium endivia]|nr:hypothetical protein L1887_19706 [Cichorium endivia]